MNNFFKNTKKIPKNSVDFNNYVHLLKRYPFIETNKFYYIGEGIFISIFSTGVTFTLLPEDLFTKDTFLFSFHFIINLINTFLIINILPHKKEW